MSDSTINKPDSSTKTNLRESHAVGALAHCMAQWVRAPRADNAKVPGFDSQIHDITHMTTPLVTK